MILSGPVHCLHCNVGLGKFRESIPNLEQAIIYLKEN